MSLNSDFGLPRACRAAGCEATRCFYCESFLAPRHEHDHFPVPARAGGKYVVAACYACHDLKDRVPFEDWPATMAVLAMGDLLELLEIDAEKLPEETLRNPLALLFSTVALNLELHAGPKWRDLSAPGRVMFAKAAAMVTGDIPVAGTAPLPATAQVAAWTSREARRELLAPWVDRDDARYSDDGPTRRFRGPAGRSPTAVRQLVHGATWPDIS